MKRALVLAALWSAVSRAFGQTSQAHVDLEVTDSPLFKIDGEQLVGETAVDEKLADLAKRNPKPVIYVRSDPGISPQVLFERSSYIMGPLREKAEKAGIKIYLIGHEATKWERDYPLDARSGILAEKMVLLP